VSALATINRFEAQRSRTSNRSRPHPNSPPVAASPPFLSNRSVDLGHGQLVQ
jgi:hypothetical protein